MWRRCLDGATPTLVQSTELDLRGPSNTRLLNTPRILPPPSLPRKPDTTPAHETQYHLKYRNL